jgi:hypothetical protein
MKESCRSDMDTGADCFFDKSTGFEAATEVIKNSASQQIQESNKNSHLKEVLT